MELPQWIADFSFMLALLAPVIVVAVGWPLGVELAQWILDLLAGGFWR